MSTDLVPVPIPNTEDRMSTYPDTSRFFDALIGADAHISDHEHQTWVATFAPQLTTYAQCSCGSVFEARDNQIAVTAEEKRAAAALLNADRAAMYRFSPEGAEWIVGRVIDAINATRTRDDQDALRDWQDAHAYCEQP